MFASPAKDKIISSQAWSDGNKLWVWEPLKADTPFHVAISDGEWIMPFDGNEGFFSIVHYYKVGDKLAITAHDFDNIEKPLFRVRITNNEISMEGDLSLWPLLRRHYVANLSVNGKLDFRLIVLSEDGEAKVIDLDWYDDEIFDKLYQGVISVTSIPGSDFLIFSVQRSSTLIIFDPSKRIIVDKIPLADRNGNPQLHFQSQRNELWAIDYDTLLCLERDTWNVKESALLQEGPVEGSRQFIGDMCFHHQEEFCSIARPFSGDVITMKLDDFKITHRTSFPKQPLQVAVADDIAYVRDWKTGEAFKEILQFA